MLMSNTLQPVTAWYGRPEIEYVDVLAGLGGGTNAIKAARKDGKPFTKVVACMNHWPTAIKSHAQSHPEAFHYVDEMSEFDPRKFLQHYTTDNYRYALFGIDCTQHSIAKGGMPRDADLRMLAEEMEPYIAVLNLRGFRVENVKEFKLWGPVIPKVIMKNRHKKSKNKKTDPDWIKAHNDVMIAFSECNENDNWKLYINDGEIYACPLIEVKELIPGTKKKRVVGLDRWNLPHPLRKGEYFQKWLKKMDSYGYHHEHRDLCSANYGGRTIRTRLFIKFNRIGEPIRWAKPTHSKDGKGGLKKWKSVRPVLDLEDEGYSIFNRKDNPNIPKRNQKEYDESTLERLYNGVLKIVLQKKEEEFICKAMGNQMDGTKSNGKSLNEPSLAITAYAGYNIAKVVKVADVIKEDAFLMKWIGDRKEDIEKYCHKSLQLSAPTIVCQNRHGLVKVKLAPDDEHTINQGELFGDGEFLFNYYGNGDNVKSLDEPAPTVPAADVGAKVKTDFLVNYNYGSDASSVENPSPSILTKDRYGKVKTEHFIDIQFSSGKQSQSIEEPIGGLVSNPKQKKVTVKKEAFITKGNSSHNNTGQNKGASVDEPSPTITGQMRTGVAQAFTVKKAKKYIADGQYKNVGKSIEEPAPTITASRHKQYIVDMQYNNLGKSVNEPAQTLIAQMGSKPPYLVNVETGEVSIIIYENDSPMTKKLKILMATYGIVDIKMRMLKVKELLQIQGFSKNTKVFGNQEEQKKQIGNSIEKYVFKAEVEADYDGLLEWEEQQLNNKAA